jgi:hypothetical protein
MVVSGRWRRIRWEESWRRRGMKAGEIRIARMRVNKKRIKDLEKKNFGVAVGIQGNEM